MGYRDFMCITVFIFYPLRAFRSKKIGWALKSQSSCVVNKYDLCDPGLTPG